MLEGIKGHLGLFFQERALHPCPRSSHAVPAPPAEVSIISKNFVWRWRDAVAFTLLLMKLCGQGLSAGGQPSAEMAAASKGLCSQGEGDFAVKVVGTPSVLHDQPGGKKQGARTGAVGREEGGTMQSRE